ncbi:MAG: hypothetical protein RL763_412, partial [Pseudomonadota bacterium]
DAHIGLESLCLPTVSTNRLHHLLGSLRVAGVIHRHGPAVLGGKYRSGRTNTAAGAGDK